MSQLKGFDAKYRIYFSQLARRGQGAFTIKKAAELLGIPEEKAKYVLNRLTKSGWLFRIKQGLYIPAPPLIEDSKPFAEDPWIIAIAVFSPCYIGAWDAISYWNLTEQIFNDTFVFTQLPQKRKKQVYLNHTFIVHKVPKLHFFGLKTVWKQDIKVKITDPSRTIIDMLDTPHLFGGIHSIYEIFLEYLRSQHKDLQLLVRYALAMKNKAISKRLGFLLEFEKLLTPDFDNQLQANMSPGKAKLVPSSDCPKLVTKWQLWVPKQWKEGNDS